MLYHTIYMNICCSNNKMYVRNAFDSINRSRVWKYILPGWRKMHEKFI